MQKKLHGKKPLKQKWRLGFECQCQSIGIDYMKRGLRRNLKWYLVFVEMRTFID